MLRKILGDVMANAKPQPTEGSNESPRRVQRKRIKGWRMPDNTVVVDRTSGFGNPFPVTKGTATCMGKKEIIYVVGTWSGPAMWVDCKTKEEAQSRAVQVYRVWISNPSQEHLRSKARLTLRGKNLACWCKPGEVCHADVLLELANGPIGGPPSTDNQGTESSTTKDFS